MATKKSAPKKAAKANVSTAASTSAPAKKPVVKKEVKEIPLYTEQLVRTYNRAALKSGMKIECTIGSKKISGHIFVSPSERDYVFICHNEPSKSANTSPNPMGYQFAYAFRLVKPENDGVKNIVITPDPSFVVPEILRVAGHSARFQKGYVRIGCQSIPNSIVRKVASRLID